MGTNLDFLDAFGIVDREILNDGVQVLLGLVADRVNLGDI
jgi:hypothetical protein